MGSKYICILENVIIQTEHLGEGKEKMKLVIQELLCVDTYTVRSERHCALRLRYVDLVVSIEVAVEVCCCCVTFRCIQLLNSVRSATPVTCLIA